MKIQKVSAENLTKALALLKLSFPDSEYEAQVVMNLHEHGKVVHDWVCLHTNKVIAYVGFSRAYQGAEVCGLHLAPLAVNPEFQRRGIGSELLRFALRQEPVTGSTIFVLGRPEFYQRFGFGPCRVPICPFAQNNANFLSIRNSAANQFTVGYEAEFTGRPPSRQSVKERGRGQKQRRCR